MLRQSIVDNFSLLLDIEPAHLGGVKLAVESARCSLACSLMLVKESHGSLSRTYRRIRYVGRL